MPVLLNVDAAHIHAHTQYLGPKSVALEGKLPYPRPEFVRDIEFYVEYFPTASYVPVANTFANLDGQGQGQSYIIGGYSVAFEHHLVTEV